MTTRRAFRLSTADALDMFAAPVIAIPTRAIRTMVRPDSSIESQAAAVRVLCLLTPIQRQVLHALADAGSKGLTDRELETLPIFAARGPSTIRKRRSELFHAGRVVRIDRRDGMAVWSIAPTEGTL